MHTLLGNVFPRRTQQTVVGGPGQELRPYSSPSYLIKEVIVLSDAASQCCTTLTWFSAIATLGVAPGIRSVRPNRLS